MQTISLPATELKLGDIVEDNEHVEIVGIVPDEETGGTWIYWGRDDQAWDSELLPAGAELEVYREVTE